MFVFKVWQPPKKIMQLKFSFLNGCGTAPGNLVYVMHHEPELSKFVTVSATGTII